MQYFIRKDSEATVTGPFSVSELMCKLETGQISPTWLASSNIGDGIERLQKYRKNDWFQVSKIPKQNSNTSANDSNNMTPVHSPLKCLRCQTEMESGFVTDRTYGGITVPNWIAGLPESSFLEGLKTIGKERYTISTYRCPKCGYIESYARD